MSVDIDWSLLATPTTTTLSETLITALNTQLNRASRPSFLGPVTVTSFDFGEIGPEVELKDIRDVWRAFDEGDEEGDALAAEIEREQHALSEYEYRGHEDEGDGYSGRNNSSASPPGQIIAPVPVQAPVLRARGARHASAPLPSTVAGSSRAGGGSGVGLGGLGGTHLSTTPALNVVKNDEPFDVTTAERERVDRDDANDSVYSGFHSGRNSVASVGLGVGGVLARRAGPGPRYPLVPSTPPRMPVPSGLGGGSYAAGPSGLAHSHRPTAAAAAAAAIVPISTPLPDRDPDSAAPLSPPPSPPVRPLGMPDARPNPLPSVQIHLRLDHASDMQLTLTTSLQVNYPSKLFMALPLKLVITGVTLAADVVLAYSGQKHRVHVTIVDAGEEVPPTPGGGGGGGGGIVGLGAAPHGAHHGGGHAHGAHGGSIGGGAHEHVHGHAHGVAAAHYAIGQRILPSLHIESDIGSADAHVLRNVGKVERFIVDVVRKTLVEELVFPNFHTIAL